MAVAFDATSNTTGNSVSSITLPHTPVGTPTAIGVGLAFYPQERTVSSVTYNSVGMTLGPTQQDSSIFYRASIYGLANPSSGAQDVVVTWTGGTALLITLGCVTVTGSDTTTCFSNTNSATGTSAAPSVTVTSATGELAFGHIADWISTFTYDAGITSQWFQNNGNVCSAGGTAPAGSSSTTMSGTLSSTSWVALAASFKAGAAGIVASSKLSILGAG